MQMEASLCQETNDNPTKWSLKRNVEDAAPALCTVLPSHPWADIRNHVIFYPAVR